MNHVIYVHISHSSIYSFVPSFIIFLVYSDGFKILVSLKKINTLILFLKSIILYNSERENLESYRLSSGRAFLTGGSGPNLSRDKVHNCLCSQLPNCKTSEAGEYSIESCIFDNIEYRF